MAVLYVPAARPLVETLALMLSTSVVVVPLVTLRPSQAADSVSDQVSVPPVGLVRFIDCANGAAPPAVPAKVRLTGFSRMLGVTVVPPPVVDVVPPEVDVVLPDPDVAPPDVGVTVPPETTSVTGTELTCPPITIFTAPL